MDFKNIGLYTALIGAITAIVGIFEILFVFTGSELWIPADLFGGLALLVIAAVYLSGIGELFTKKEEGLSFALTGTILTMVFGILYTLMAGADWLMYTLGEADEFLIISELRPEILISIAALPLTIYLFKRKSSPTE